MYHSTLLFQCFVLVIASCKKEQADEENPSTTALGAPNNDQEDPVDPALMMTGTFSFDTYFFNDLHTDTTNDGIDNPVFIRDSVFVVEGYVGTISLDSIPGTTIKWGGIDWNYPHDLFIHYADSSVCRWSYNDSLDLFWTSGGFCYKNASFSSDYQDITIFTQELDFLPNGDTNFLNKALTGTRIE